MRRGVVAAVAVVLAAVVVAAAWLLWPRPGSGAAASSRRYLGVSACLLTGSGGVAPGTAGGRVWRVMESASVASRVMVSYLPASGAAVPVLLNTLVEQRCGVIVVTGGSRAQVAGVARANPGRRFILVTGSAAAGPAVVPANAVVVPAAGASGPIDQEITALAGAA